MDLEFDKEMDALLRRSAPRGVLVGDTAKLHLDADALAAFAENAVPEKSRRIYTEHLAECDPCRKTLSGLIMLNAGAEPEQAAAVAAPVVASIQWYRKLFTTPNLAYTFGGLILLFGGLIGFVTFQNIDSGDVAVSQLKEAETRSSAPAAEPMAVTSNANSSANTATTANNATGEIPRAVGSEVAPIEGDTAQPPPAPPVVASSPTGTGFASTTTPSKPITMDGLAASQPQPAPKEVAKSADEERKMRVEDKQALNEQEKRKQDADANTLRARQLNQNQVQMMPDSGNTKDSGPNRANQRDNRGYDDASTMKAKKAEAAESPSAGARSDTTSGRKQAGGKTFELKQGAWYDTAYRGQSTKNVRRKSDDYQKLDGGLRSVADSIGGTVVVVWSGKAYRIQ